MGYGEAYEKYRDGELSLFDLGEVLLEQGVDPRAAREKVSRDTGTTIPVNYFGYEG